jgi:glycerol uptake facilitator-like aquaporin
MDPRAAKVGGFAIGVTVAAATLMGGPLTGAAMNPARAFGPAVAANFWDNHLVYWIGPLCGAVIAGLVYGWYLMDARQGENAT